MVQQGKCCFASLSSCILDVSCLNFVSVCRRNLLSFSSKLYSIPLHRDPVIRVLLLMLHEK